MRLLEVNVAGAAKRAPSSGPRSSSLVAQDDRESNLLDGLVEDVGAAARHATISPGDYTTGDSLGGTGRRRTSGSGVPPPGEGKLFPRRPWARPVAYVEAPYCDDRRRTPFVLNVESPSLAGVCILVVDDHDDGREALEQVLTQAGATVIPAASARAALTHLDAVELIVTDYFMPGETGLWLLERVGGRDRTAPGPGGGGA